MRIKALSVRQPWAWALAQGHKDVENRTWRTEHRGPFLIHASETYDPDDFDWIEKHIGIPVPEELPAGGIVGVALLVACAEAAYESPWFAGPHGFVVKHAAPLPFTECKGRLNFWTPDASVTRALSRQISKWRKRVRIDAVDAWRSLVGF